MPRLTVRGQVLDDQTRCVHWHTELDVVAIRLACCEPFYPCRQCHDDDADHVAATWPRTAYDERAVLCGVCRTPLRIADYLDGDDACPHCAAAFNPGCRLHHELYFG